MENLSKADKFLFNLMFILGALVVIGNLLDMATTYFALQLPHTSEANPAMAYVIRNWGWVPFFLIKSFFCVLFFPIKYSPLIWVVDYSLRMQNNVISNAVKQINVGAALTSYILTSIWFWYLGITNFFYLI